MDALAMDAGHRLPTLSAHDEAALRRRWHPVAPVRALKDSESGAGPVATRLLDEALVVALLGQHTVVMRDGCGHKPYPLSRGRVGESPQGIPTLRCAYHGWAWNEMGRCVDLPSFPFPVTTAGLPLERVPVFEAQVAFGLIWVRLEPDPDTAVPELAGPTARGSFTPAESWICDVALSHCVEWMSRTVPYARLVRGLSIPSGADVVDAAVVALGPPDSGYLVLSPTGWRTTTVYRLVAAPSPEVLSGARVGPPRFR